MSDKILPCPVCGKVPVFYCRWRSNGCGELTKRYSWLECDSVPPHITSINGDDDEKIIDDWNQKVALKA